MILKYYAHEARRLQALGEIPATARLGATDVFDDDGQEEEVVFGLAPTVGGAAAGGDAAPEGDAWESIIAAYEEDLEDGNNDFGGDDEIDDI